MLAHKAHCTTLDSCPLSMSTCFHLFSGVCCCRVVDIGMEGFAEKHNGSENDGFIDGKEFSELLLPLVILIFAIIQTHYFYSPLPQEFLDQQAETRRDRKLLKKEADRQRKLVSGCRKRSL